MATQQITNGGTGRVGGQSNGNGSQQTSGGSGVDGLLSGPGGLDRFGAQPGSVYKVTQIARSR